MLASSFCSSPPPGGGIKKQLEWSHGQRKNKATWLIHNLDKHLPHMIFKVNVKLANEHWLQGGLAGAFSLAMCWLENPNFNPQGCSWGVKAPIPADLNEKPHNYQANCLRRFDQRRLFMFSLLLGVEKNLFARIFAVNKQHAPILTVLLCSPQKSLTEALHL